MHWRDRLELAIRGWIVWSVLVLVVADYLLSRSVVYGVWWFAAVEMVLAVSMVRGKCGVVLFGMSVAEQEHMRVL